MTSPHLEEVAGLRTVSMVMGGVGQLRTMGGRCGALEPRAVQAQGTPQESRAPQEPRTAQVQGIPGAQGSSDAGYTPGAQGSSGAGYTPGAQGRSGAGHPRSPGYLGTHSGPLINSSTYSG